MGHEINDVPAELGLVVLVRSLSLSTQRFAICQGLLHSVFQEQLRTRSALVGEEKEEAEKKRLDQWLGTL